MIAADFRVCLDACVLANQGLCDLMLRLAEFPPLYSPVFSDEILAEVRRVDLPARNAGYRDARPPAAESRGSISVAGGI